MSACVAHKSSEICESAAAAGCQILCEKPIATSLADAETMRTVCEKNGVRFMTAFPMRFAPSARAVRALINEGGLGGIFGISGINHSEIPQAMIEEFIDSIRSQREPCVSWNDGYQALRVALAAYESARNMEPVKLEHPQT